MSEHESTPSPPTYQELTEMVCDQTAALERIPSQPGAAADMAVH